MHSVLRYTAAAKGADASEPFFEFLRDDSLPHPAEAAA
jgi:hypothetical protein